MASSTRKFSTGYLSNLRKASDLLKQKEYKAAIEYSDKTINDRTSPGHIKTKALMNKTNCYLKLYKIEGKRTRPHLLAALTTLQSAPKSTLTNSLKVQVLIALGKHDNDSSILREALAINALLPEKIQTKLNALNIHYLLNELDSAINIGLSLLNKTLTVREIGMLLTVLKPPIVSEEIYQDLIAKQAEVNPNDIMNKLSKLIEEDKDNLSHTEMDELSSKFRSLAQEAPDLWSISLAHANLLTNKCRGKKDIDEAISLMKVIVGEHSNPKQRLPEDAEIIKAWVTIAIAYEKSDYQDKHKKAVEAILCI